MALFGTKKETTKQAPVEKKGATAPVYQGSNYAAVLRNPRITEKASENMARGVYVFDIAPNATKQQVKEAIKRVYKVDAARIRVATIPNKKTRNLRTGTRGTKGGGKKAYVYLKKGDQISVM